MKSLLLYVAIKIISVTSNYNHADPSNDQTDETSNFKELHKNIDYKNYRYFDETNIPIEKYILNNNNFQPNNGGTRVIRYSIKKIPLGEENIVTNYNNEAEFKKYVLNDPNEVHIDGYNGEQNKIKTTYFWPDSQSVRDNKQVIPLSLDQERNIDISKMQTLSEKDIINRPPLAKHWGANEDMRNLFKLAEIRKVHEQEPTLYTENDLVSDLKTGPDRSQENRNISAISYLVNLNGQNRNSSKIYGDYRTATQRLRKSYPWYKVLLESKANQQRLKGNHEDVNILQREVSHEQPKGYITPYEMAKLYESMSKMKNGPEYKIDLQKDEKNELLSNLNTKRDKVSDTLSSQKVQSNLQLSNQPLAKEFISQEKEKLHKVQLQVKTDPESNLQLEKQNEILSHDNQDIKKVYETDSNSFLQSNDVLKSNNKSVQYYHKTPLEHHDEDEHEHILNKNFYKQYLKIYLNQVFSKVSVTIGHIQKLLNLDMPNIIYKTLREYAHLSLSMFDVLAEIDEYYGLINHRSHRDFLTTFRRKIIEDYKHDNGNKYTENLVNLIKKYESVDIEVKRHPKHVFDVNTDETDIQSQPSTKTESNEQLKEQNVIISNDNSKPNELNNKTPLEHRDDDEQKLNRIAYKKYLKIYLNQVFSKVSLKIDFIQKLLSYDGLNSYEILKEYAQLSTRMFNALEKMDTYYSLINRRSTQDFLATLRTNIIEDDQPNIGHITAENIIYLTKKYNSQISKEEKDLGFVTYLQHENTNSLLNVTTDDSKRDEVEPDFELGNQPQASESMPYVVEKLDTFKQEVKKDHKSDVQLNDQTELLPLDTTDIKKIYGSDDRPQSNGNFILKSFDEKWNHVPNYNKSTEFNDKIIYFHKLYHKMYLNKELLNIKRRIELMQMLLTLDELNLYDLLKEYTQIPTTVVDLLTEIAEYHRLKNHIILQDLISIIRSNMIEDYSLDSDDINTNNMLKYLQKDIFPYNLLKHNFEKKLFNSNCNKEDAADLIMRFELDLANKLSSIGCSRNF
ncbi:uncharacterized protein LOC126778432 [Nymphalis io]|uniref:uncharacterized protein LOC126778432 n=1 Tax=Inachis io TaxID=171585 RepID=UPI002167C8D9|nr:uncharacterized protein LOC126778432 [Nymphalis io]